MSSYARVAGWILTLILVSGCASGPISKASQVEGDLRGMLYDLDRQPLSEASVTIEFGQNSTVVLTDLHGRFGAGPIRFGPVSLSIAKPGFEPLKWEFRFVEGSQVLYLQMPSTDQLFEKAALALEKKEWKTVQDFLDRARKLSPTSLQGYILAATALEERGKLSEAIALLEGYQSEHTILAVELFLADLYAAVGEKDKALARWKNALDIREDADVRTRMEALSRAP